jgi:hypothetical protein
MEVFLADRISDEENQETVDGTSKFQNARMPGKRLIRHQHLYGKSTVSVPHRHSGIRVSPVPLVTDKSGIAQLWTCLVERNITVLNTSMFKTFFVA